MKRTVCWVICFAAGMVLIAIDEPRLAVNALLACLVIQAGAK